jgi:hypothetical protein
MLTGRTALDWWNGNEVFSIMCIVGGFQVFYFVVGYFVHDVMDQRFYEEVGTDIELKDITTSQMRFWSMCKIDLQMVHVTITMLHAIVTILCMYRLYYYYSPHYTIQVKRNTIQV